jgi:shikimate kinase
MTKKERAAGSQAMVPVSLALPGGRRQIHLTGFMGAGKSTVGRLLARRLLWNFLDLDGVIERQEGRSVARIFAESGEETFRELERAVLRQVVLKPATVVALGGGTLIDPDNRALCATRAAIVWLRAPLEVLRARCAENGESTISASAPQVGKRPLWGDSEALRARFEERLPGYQTATIVVDAAAEPERVVDAVLEALPASSGCC